MIIETFYGKILVGYDDEDDEDSVLVVCLINENPQVLQTRKFSKSLFDGHIPITQGQFISIKIKTVPGEMSINISPVNEDLTALFIKKDNFEDDFFDEDDYIDYIEDDYDNYEDEDEDSDNKK